MSIKDPLGVLGTGETGGRDIKAWYDAGDGWQIVMYGEETRRPKSLERVAITRAEVTLSSNEHLKKLIEVLKASDERLAEIPDNSIMYDWQIVRSRNLTIRFGVAWYDREYYRQKQNVWKLDMHDRMFADFGVAASDFRIEHIPF